MNTRKLKLKPHATRSSHATQHFYYLMHHSVQSVSSLT